MSGGPRLGIKGGAKAADLAVALALIGALCLVIVPLPPALVDPLLIFNIAVSVAVLLAAVGVARPLEFSAFPSLVLILTFFRLSLNIATTRLILTRGAEGAGAAGEVVQAFGSFVAGANPVVGLVIFAVIAIVQFVVITRGATRVAEVAARFQLDSLPGRQLSVDGDLARGRIGETEAEERRRRILEEADFYGAMDGASRFVRGDAVATLCILAVNLAGGLAVGMLFHGMSAREAVSVFARLTVGDGLVSQVPALLVSMAAALLVTRNPASERLGRDLLRQVFESEYVLFVAGAFLLLLLPAGLPPLPLVLSALGCGVAGAGMRLARRSDGAHEGDEAAPPTAGSAGRDAVKARTRRRTATSAAPSEPLAIELGFRACRFADPARGSNLLEHIAALRELFSLELGIPLPPVAVRDARDLAPWEYAVRLRGQRLGRWRVLPEGVVLVERVPGGADRADPADFLTGGRRAWWVEPEAACAAPAEEVEIVGPVRALALHLEALARRHADEFVDRAAALSLLADLKARSPGAIPPVLEKDGPPARFVRTLQALAREGVSLRDLGRIAGAFEEHQELPFEESLAAVRVAVRRSVCAGVVAEDGRLHAVVLSEDLEARLEDSVIQVGELPGLALEPGGAEVLFGRLGAALIQAARSARRAAVLAGGRLRRPLAEELRRHGLFWPVVAYEEVVEGVEVEIHAIVGGLEADSEIPEPAESEMKVAP